MIWQLIIITVVHNGAGRVVNKIPTASVVTPGTDVEPTPAFVTNMTFMPEPRIVGGDPADITEFPFLVNIEYNRVHWCGGSYIQPTWILTAAHCLLNPATGKQLSPEGYLVKMGATTLNDKTASSRRVLNVIPHVGFHTHNNSCDIGLIEIESPFGTSPKIAMIELPKHFSTYESFEAAVAGWGVTRQEDMGNQRKQSQHLLKVIVPVIAQESCRNLYSIPKYVELFEGNKVLCAGYIEGGKDACQGDSGGPLAHNDILIGIVSWGIGCGNEIPGVYTNVYHYLQWIKGSMSNTSFNLRKAHNASPAIASNTIRYHIIFGILCILLLTS